MTKAEDYNLITGVNTIGKCDINILVMNDNVGN